MLFNLTVSFEDTHPPDLSVALKENFRNQQIMENRGAGTPMGQFA